MRSDLTEEQKEQFFKEQEEKVNKLRNLTPKANMDMIVSEKELEKIKEYRKQENKKRYWNYHKKPANHQDNWKTI